MTFIVKLDRSFFRFSEFSESIGSKMSSVAETKDDQKILYDAITESFRDRLEGVYKKVLKEKTKEGVNNYRGGAFWASWGAYISYIRDVLGWRGSTLPKFEIEERMILSCGWIWWHEDVAVISDRPKAIRFDENQRLHSDNSPSIEYRDGWSMYHWHGIAMPVWAYTNPELLTAEKIDEEPNQEVRRALMEKLGYGEYMKDSKVVHEDDTGVLRSKKNKKGDVIKIVEVLNGSLEPDGTRKTYLLSVPPEMKRAKEAVAWTYGMTEKEYSNLVVRT